MNRLIIVTLVTALVVIGCGQELRSPCLEELDCPPCNADIECVVASNPCHETAACVHRDDEIAIAMDGCNFEYDVPPDSECVCRASVCAARE